MTLLLTLRQLNLPRGSIGEISAVFSPGLHLIVGPNGIGKSSLLSSIAGALPPKSGAILLNGEPLAGSSARVVLAPGTPPPLPWIRAGLLLDFVISLYAGTRRDDEFKRELLKQLGIEGFLSSNMGSLSAGTAKKILLSAALVAAPPVVLLDEPTNEIDAQSRSVVLQLLAESAKTRVVLVTSHHRAEFAALAPTVLELGAQQCDAPAIHKA